MVEPGLVDNPRVMLLPHIGTMTYETQKDMEVLVLDNVRSAVEKGKLVTPIPEQKQTGKANGANGANGTNGVYSKV